jgi:hypothetical protein
MVISIYPNIEDGVKPPYTQSSSSAIRPTTSGSERTIPRNEPANNKLYVTASIKKMELTQMNLNQHVN